MTDENYMKFEIQCPSVKFLWNTPRRPQSHSFLRVHGAFERLQQTWVIASGPRGPQSLKCLLSGPLEKQLAAPAAESRGQTEPGCGRRVLGLERGGVCAVFFHCWSKSGQPWEPARE